MPEPIYKIVDNLPKSNMTIRMLKALDWVVPGQWDNLVGFENSVKVISGETEPGVQLLNGVVPTVNFGAEV